MPKRPNTIKKIVKRAVKTVKGRGDYSLATTSNADLIKEGAGRVASKIWTTLFGNGDYTPHANVNTNSLMASITANGPPSVSSDRLRRVRMSHRESLGKVFSSVDFQNRSFSINPGNSKMFPWLHVIAQSFQQYELKGMVFEYLSTSANALNSTNTALGTVLMVTNYDSVAPPFTSRTQMENSEFCSVTRPSRSMLHPIECKPQLSTLKTLYVRGEIESDYDLRFYDFGRFQLATEGMQQADVEIGELWVSYDIEFLKPINQTAGGQSSIGYFAGDNTIPLIGPDNMLANYKWHRNDLGIKILDTSDGISFPLANPGDQYLITWFITTQVQDTEDPDLAFVPSGLKLLEFHYNQNGSIEAESEEYTREWPVTATWSSFTVAVEITDPVVLYNSPPYLQFSWGADWTGASHLSNIRVSHVQSFGIVAEPEAPKLFKPVKTALAELKSLTKSDLVKSKLKVSPPSTGSFKPEQPSSAQVARKKI